MKKVFLSSLFCIGLITSSFAQLDFGVKAGLNYNSFGNAKSVAQDIIIGAKGKSGFHVGVFAKVKLPIVGFYLRPELVYTQLKSEYNSIDFELSKIDVPILIGTKIAGPLHVFIGPAFQFVIDSKFKTSEAININTDDFSLGIQMGFGVELGKLGIDVRWERGLSKTESKISSVLAPESNFSIDTRASQIIFGLSYRFGE